MRFLSVFGPPDAQICCVYHIQIDIFMSRKSHDLSCFLVSQNDAKSMKRYDCWSPKTWAERERKAKSIARLSVALVDEARRCVEESCFAREAFCVFFEVALLTYLLARAFEEMLYCCEQYSKCTEKCPRNAADMWDHSYLLARNLHENKKLVSSRLRAVQEMHRKMSQKCGGYVGSLLLTY